MVVTRKKGLSVVFVVVLSVLMFCKTSVLAKETSLPQEKSYVDDYAGVVSQEIENEMQERAIAFEKATNGVQVVIVTVRTVGDAEMLLSATNLYNENNIGKNGMGMLILLATQTRNVQIRVGNSMSKCLTDATCGDIRIQGVPYFRKGYFETGLDEMQKYAIEVLESKNLNAENETVAEVREIPNTQKPISACITIMAIGMAIVASLMWYAEREKRKDLEEKHSKVIKKLNKQIEKIEKKYNLAKSREVIKYNEICALEKEVNTLKIEIDNEKERMKLASSVFPNLEQKIEDILTESDKKVALEMENNIMETLELEHTKQNLSKFRSVFEAYADMPCEQKKFVPKELVNMLSQAYNESLREFYGYGKCK